MSAGPDTTPDEPGGGAGNAMPVVFRAIAPVLECHLLHAVTRFGVPDALSDTPRPAEEIADALGLHRDALRRALHALAQSGYVAEGPPGLFALNDAMRALRSDSEMPGATLLLTHVEHSLPLYAAVGHTIETGEPASEKVYGKSYFAHLAERPEAQRGFVEGLGRVGTLAFGPALARLAQELTPRVRKVVDVGGGDGFLAEGLLRGDPELRAAVLDLPSVLDAARDRLAKAGLLDRCELVPGSFFETAPAGADAYVIARCLHNWNDERAVAILRTVRAAMGTEARLFVLEQLVPEEQDDSAAYPDLLMMLIGGSERTESQYARLMADAGLRLTGTRPFGPGVGGVTTSLLEAVPA
ncbi:methyltransferase [Streptomyces sp. NPDC048172]|uniref:methyltransferase n=1 Tax=Streptomyces sp. NPDC048172 TaxID=3365505 RepID=UPI003712D159